MTLEKISHEDAFDQALQFLDMQVASFTSDRHSSIAMTMAKKYPAVVHHFDSWHFVRNITLDLLKVTKNVTKVLKLKCS